MYPMLFKLLITAAGPTRNITAAWIINTLIVGKQKWSERHNFSVYHWWVGVNQPRGLDTDRNVGGGHQLLLQDHCLVTGHHLHWQLRYSVKKSPRWIFQLKDSGFSYWRRWRIIIMMMIESVNCGWANACVENWRCVWGLCVSMYTARYEPQPVSYCWSISYTSWHYRWGRRHFVGGSHVILPAPFLHERLLTLI